MPDFDTLDGIYIVRFPERRPGIAAQKKLDVKLAREAAVTGSAEASGYPVEGPPFPELKRPKQLDQKWIDYTFDPEEWAINPAVLIPIERDAGWRVMEELRKKLAASTVAEDVHGWWYVDQSRREREAEASGQRSFFQGEREERDPYTARGAGRRAAAAEYEEDEEDYADELDDSDPRRRNMGFSDPIEGLEKMKARYGYNHDTHEEEDDEGAARFLEEEARR